MEIGIGSVTSKGQVTIPKQLRERLGLKRGDKLVFSIEGDQTTIRKVKREKLSEILSRQEVWGEEESVKFQRKLRKEWRESRQS